MTQPDQKPTAEEIAEGNRWANEVIDELLADEQSWRETVRVGDMVDAHSDQHFTFSKTRYLTSGRLYRVKALDFRPREKSYCVIVDSDVEGEIAWLSDSRVIIRDGVIVWTPDDARRKRAEAREKAAQPPKP